MKSGILVVAVVAITAILGLALSSNDPTGQYIRKNVVEPGAICGPTDMCMAGFTCLAGRCQINTGQMEVLPGQLCTQNTPCKFGYACIDGRCQRP